MPLEKTFDAAARERELYRAWEEAGAFRAGAGAKPGAEPFSVMIPPPNVTGSLHMGHAFNNTLQDILVRWHRMRGHDTLWQPGTDHAGIATQMVVERELAKEGNLGRRELGREKFIERVWEQKRKSRGNIRAQLERLGASCDWSREAFTMGGAPGDPEAGEGPNFHDAVIRVFVDWYEKGLIYRGKRLVNWDPHFETAISDLEVENVEVDGFMWHFRYPLAGGATYRYVEKDADGAVIVDEERDWISIATTRPETMLGDGAVAVHPSDERYTPIVGQLCEIPVGPKEHRRLIPIITDDYPDPTFGSGAVKITGAHDFNDYAVAQRNGIPLYRLMDTKARMRDDGLPYAEAAATAGRIARRELDPASADIDALNLVPDDLRGLDRFETRKRVVEAITAEGLAVVVKNPRFAALEGGPADPVAPEPETIPLVEAKKITQPFGDRSKVVIEPMLTDQWFVDTARIVQPAMDAVRDGRTAILPERDAKTYFHWLENIEPWCISRQLWWGHQIPVWYGPKKNEPLAKPEDNRSPRPTRERLEASDTKDDDSEVLSLSWSPNSYASAAFCAASEGEARDKAERYYGGPVRVVADLNDAFELELGSGEWTPIWRDPDVLDTWFSSGLWPIGTLGWPEDTPELRRYFPTSVLVTGFDIIFFWVARMMMMQLEIVEEVPFRTVYVHALVRDEKGKKMSKSLGNVLDPLDLIGQYGADAVRFTLAAMAAMGRDLRLSEGRIAGYRNFVTKLWNAHRFAEMNGVFEHERVPGLCTGGGQVVRPPEATETANRWIIGETARVRAEVDEALEAFRFDAAAGTLYAFVWGRVCDWYLELAKPLFEGDRASETRAVTAWVLDQCLLLLHPFMPFVTEELWSMSAKRDGLLALSRWPIYGTEIIDEEAQSEMRWVISLIEGIRSARGEVNVPPAARAPLIPVELSSSLSEAWRKNLALVERVARVEAVSPGAAPKGSLTITVEGATFALPVADLIDVAAEKLRLAKTLEKLSKELSGLSGRLRNPRFIEGAPEEVVAETREALAAKEDEAARLRAALARLEELA